jgi:hypothetical protein
VRRFDTIVMIRWVQVGVLSSAMAAWAPGHASQAPDHAAQTFSFFTPVVELGADDIERIHSGRVVTQTIGGSGHELAVLAAGSLNVIPDAFVSRVSGTMNAPPWRNRNGQLLMDGEKPIESLTISGSTAHLSLTAVGWAQIVSRA